MTRIWEAYGSIVNPSGSLVYVNIFPHLSALRLCGIKLEDVRTLNLVEDLEGDYYGWVPAGSNDIRMVQYKKIFLMQFPYSVEEEVAAGHGEVVRLRVEEVA